MLFILVIDQNANNLKQTVVFYFRIHSKRPPIEQQRVAIRVILVNEHNEVLLLKRTHTKYGFDKWCLPGGNQDRGNTEQDTCTKEY